MELNRIEKLAVAQAFYKAAGEYVSTKDPSNLRAEADAYYKALYQESGAKSFDVNIGEMKVGTYSIKVDKPKDAGRKFKVKDPTKLLEWIDTADDEAVRKFAYNNSAAFAEWIFYRTGEMPDGCHLAEMPATKGGYAGGSLRIETEKVAAALGANLPDAMNQLLLEGGQDDDS